MATVTSSKRQLTHTSNTYESNGDVTIGGNLNINGTTTTIDTANLLVEDKNIIIGDVSSPSDSTADGGGITLKGTTDKTLIWVDSTDAWTSNQKFSAPSLALTGLTTSSETTALLINASNQVVKRTLGSNAFNSTSFLTGNQTITLSGDVSGSGTTSISVTVADDSHNHVISNVDGLQSALDGKLGSSEKAADSNLLDGIDSSAFLRSNAADTASGTITFTGGIRSPYLETTNTNQSLFLRPNGGGSLYIGDSGNGANLYHYSNDNDGVYTTYDFNGNYYRVSTTATSGLKIDDPLHVSGNLTATTTSSSENSTKVATTAYVKSQGYITSADGGNATTLDGIDSTSFLRSDANDSFSGNLTNNGSNHITFGPNSTWAKNLRIGGNGHQGNSTTANIATTNGNLHLDAAVGSYGTYLNYYAGTTGVAFGNGASAAVAWMGPDGDLWKGPGDNSGSKYWHAGNDGSGSGLDADSTDGLHVHNTQSTQNSANAILRTQANGYTKLGWIETTSGNNNTTAISRIYASHDSYIRYYTPANFGAQIGSHISYNDLTNKPTIPSAYSLPLSSSSTRGGVKIGFSESGKNYPVELDSSEKMFVNVPWVDTNTDTNTTYSAGTHLALSGTTFNLNLGVADKVVNIGHNSTSNEGEIILDTSVAGSPQISFTEHGDASWAIGVDDGDNSFKIHGSPNSTIPTINSLTTPLFEITTAGVGYLQGSRVFADNYHPNADTLTTARTISLGSDLSGSASFNGGSDITINAQIAANAVGTSEIAANAVGSSEIANNAVGAAEIANDAVGADQIAAGAVGSSELATNSVTATKIAGNAVGASELNVVGNGSTAQFLRSDGDGTFTWATPTDTNTDTNTTYSAGTGLTLSGTTFSITDTISSSASNNTIVKRHSSGYIFANYFNTTPNTVSSGVTQICVETGNDGYIRHGTAAAVRSFINVASGANNYSLPAGSSSTRGGFKIGYAESGKYYPVEVDSSEKMFVNVPWTDTNTDTNTTYSAGSGISLSGTTFSLTDTASKLSLSGGTMTGTINSRDIKFANGYHLMRSNHSSGHLEGSYNNVGENSTKSNPIYTIGSSYNPTDAALSNMYGVGYTHTNASFISMTGASGWGMYVAADGDARVFLGGANGAISSTGEHYVGSSRVFHDTYHPNADTLTTTRNIALAGDVTGSVNFNGSSNVSITTSLAANSVAANEIAANAVGASEIAASAVGASELNVSGNGSSSQFLRSDGDGTFTWATPTDTNTNTTYSAGRGLDLSGTQFLLETDLRDSISYIGYDSNDYVQWSNNSYFRSVVNGSERFRVNTSGIDVTGTATANAFRTDTGNTDYNVFSRNSTSTTLWVQAAQSGSLQGIASFRYGSATVNQGTEVCAIRRNSSYFINTKLGVGTSSPSVTLDVEGTIGHKVYTIASLPSASPAGQRAFVSNSGYSLQSSHGSTLTGGGSYTIPVYSDGSSWRAG